MEFEMKRRTKQTRSVCGWGINDVDFCTSYRGKDGKMIHHPAYATWFNMINRVKGGKNPFYKDCTVSEKWRNFSSFLTWWKENYVEGYALDKDLKIPGNKEYSPSACLYIPVWMNTYISARTSKHSPGVCYDKNLRRYKAQRTPKDPRGRYIGYFDTEQEAHEAWVQDLDEGILPDLSSLETNLLEIFIKWNPNKDIYRI